MLLKTPRQQRPGKVLILFVIVLTTLLAMVGLVIDGGLVMASHRQTQNLADSAALAAAMDLMRGDSSGTATASANTFISTHNGILGATITVNIPPTTGPHAGSSRHVEVIVSRSLNTIFMKAAGGLASSTVSARAVAGFEPVASGEGAIILDPEARPGVSVTGGARLVVNGSVVVNSRAGGIDQYGDAVDWGLQPHAMITSNDSWVAARTLHVRGGVDTLDRYIDYETYQSRLPNPFTKPTDPSPLFCRSPIASDPLRELPVPRQANVASITNWTRQPAVVVNPGKSQVFKPGVYEDIQINSGAVVFFNPGVYIFSPTKPNQGLRMNGNCLVTGLGVMFYMTGSNYLTGSPGQADALDDAQAALDGPLPPTNAVAIPPSTDTGTVDFATFECNVTNANVVLHSLNEATSPHNGVLFFQRRRNMNTARIEGDTGVNVSFKGSIYAKWAEFALGGGGRYDAQFVVGRLSLSGQATITINSNGKILGRANHVFLVE